MTGAHARLRRHRPGDLHDGPEPARGRRSRPGRGRSCPCTSTATRRTCRRSSPSPASTGSLVIEDACQAHGAEYREPGSGTLGDAAAFSFYYSKNLGAYGEGGMVVTKDRDIATKVQLLRNHGSKAATTTACQGINSRLDEIQAAILRIKLRYLDQWNTERRTCARDYNQRLADIDRWSRPPEQPYAKHVYHLYVIRVPRPRRPAALAEAPRRATACTTRCRPTCRRRAAPTAIQRAPCRSPRRSPTRSSRCPCTRS